MRGRGIVSQRELARRLKVSHAAVWRWMNTDAVPRAADITALSRELQVSRYEVYVELGLLPPEQEDRYLRVIGLLEHAEPDDIEKIMHYAQYVLGR
jgi:transcriptional regulator with XRE-family HTH domain